MLSNRRVYCQGFLSKGKNNVHERVMYYKIFLKTIINYYD